MIIIPVLQRRKLRHSEQISQEQIVKGGESGLKLRPSAANKTLLKTQLHCLLETIQQPYLFPSMCITILIVNQTHLNGLL